MNRVDAEKVIRALVGGAFPEENSIIIFDPEVGWTLRVLDEETHDHDERYYTKAEVDALLAP